MRYNKGIFLGMKAIQKWLFCVFENESKSFSGKFLEQILFWLIVVNVLSTTLETIPFLSWNFSHFFWRFEIFSLVIFTLEYCARVWTASLQKNYSSRWQYMASPLMIFDALVILPFFFLFFLPLDTRFVRIFRILRVFRIFRIVRFSDALERILVVLRREKSEIIAIFFLILVLIFFSSTLIFFAEKSVNTDFSSVPAAFWWSLATLTTIGYGDMVPITPLGKVISGITALFGMGVFALLTGLLGSSFYREVTERRQQNIHAEIAALKNLTEEKGEEVDLLFHRQNLKVQILREELKKIREAAEKDGIDFSEIEKL